MGFALSCRQNPKTTLLNDYGVVYLTIDQRIYTRAFVAGLGYTFYPHTNGEHYKQWLLDKQSIYTAGWFDQLLYPPKALHASSKQKLSLKKILSSKKQTAYT